MMNDPVKDANPEDVAKGNCVKPPGPDYRIATTEERRQFTKAAKELALAGKWEGRIDKRNAVYGPFGHWWVLTNPGASASEAEGTASATSAEAPTKKRRSKK